MISKDAMKREMGKLGLFLDVVVFFGVLKLCIAVTLRQNDNGDSVGRVL